MVDWWTVDEVAARYKIKRRYAYRLASIQQWRRRRDGRRVRYCRADVEASLEPGRRRTR